MGWLILLLVTGLLCLVKGGDLFVASSVQLSERLHVPRVVIGTTLVSLATTIPEIVVSILAGLRGHPDLPVGNALGSSLCNLCLIVGTLAALAGVSLNPRLLRRPYLAMMIALAVAFALALDRSITSFDGLLLLIGGSVFFFWDLARHWMSATDRETAEAKEIETEFAGREPGPRGVSGEVLVFIVGALMVVGGSRLLVDQGIALATRLGIPPLVIGLTVVALGTSLPELATTLAAVRRGVCDLALGNLLGANVANLTLVIGSAALFHEVTVTPLTRGLHFPALLFVALAIPVLAGRSRQLRRPQGWVLVGSFAAYLSGLAILTLLGLK